MINDKIYFFQEAERKLLLALCDSRKKGKELINSALEDLEKLRTMLNENPSKR